jgi:hypothetical protein
MSMKNSNDNIGNRTSDLPACSTVPQPTAPRMWWVKKCGDVTLKAVGTYSNHCVVKSLRLAERLLGTGMISVTLS